MPLRELGSADAALFATLRERAGAHYPVWLDSAVAGSLGRTSILAAFPQETLVLWGDGRLEGSAGATDFTGALDQWWRRLALPIDPQESALAFRGGWIIYLSYEFAREMEPTLRLPPAAADAPLAVAIRIPAALLLDESSGRLTAMVEEGFESHLGILEADCAKYRGHAVRHDPLPGATILEDDPLEFERAVARAHEHIAAGDTYQANLSRRWRVIFDEAVPAAAIYAQLRRANPAPFAAWADLPGLSLFSSSPERLVQVAGWSDRDTPDCRHAASQPPARGRWRGTGRSACASQGAGRARHAD